jgi:CDP-diacylglycerol--glycerol-3-phosphate 3-phosphatidyltransferase
MAEGSNKLIFQILPRSLLYLVNTVISFRGLVLKLTSIPWLLVGLRCTIAPLLLLDALDGNTGKAFILGYVVAFLSDIFDGIIARKLEVSTVKLRQADSGQILVYISALRSVFG